MKNVLIDSQLSNKINDYVYQYARENLISKWTIGSTDKDICQAILESCTIVGMTKISESTGLNRSHLYRAFGPNGNPTLSTVMTIIKYFGLQFKVETI